jgi:glycosyltransferase involved in cell wall biosynthesis
MSDPSPKTPVSVLICTKNEERNLSDCLKGVAWEQGARVVQRRFDNFSTHKNWALDNIDFRHDWVLIVDADERVTPELAREIAALVTGSPPHNGYYLARQNWFAGTWIRHGGWYPDWNLRLLRRGRGRYEPRLVGEHILLAGPPGYLKNPVVHHDYKGIERYFDRHNTYSSLEAVEAHRTLTAAQTQGLPAQFWAKGPERRRFLKNLAYRYLPGRPLFKFIWMYVFKLGFLDGRMGFRYCLLHTFYDYQISLKLEELRDPQSPMSQKYRDMSA